MGGLIRQKRWFNGDGIDNGFYVKLHVALLLMKYSNTACTHKGLISMSNILVDRKYICHCGSGKEFKECCYQPLPKSPLMEKGDELIELLDYGYWYLEKGKKKEAFGTWFQLWEELKLLHNSECRNINNMCFVFYDKDDLELIYDWCQRFGMELGYAGRKNKNYYHKRISYYKEFCSIFPDSDELIIYNMRRALAESHYAIGNIAIGQILFKELVEQYPTNIWSYIGWGDMYMWPLCKNNPPEIEKAEQIYRTALGLGLNEERLLLERLEKCKKYSKKSD